MPRWHLHKTRKLCQGTLKKCGLDSSKNVKTLMTSNCKLDLDSSGKLALAKVSRNTIGFSLYLTRGKLDIIFNVWLYARFKSGPTKSHLKVVKRIFKYLARTKEPWSMVSKKWWPWTYRMFDANYACCKTNRKSTFGFC